ncbi:MAG: hypothetical protein ACHQIO_18015 [Nevskiales bacterium]
MPKLFTGRSRHIEFIGAAVNLRRIMFARMFDPSSVLAIRLLIVLTQAGAALLIVTTIIAIRRWLVNPVVQRLRDQAMFGPRCRD